MRKQVYVGAKYCERAAAKRLMRALEAQGHRITVDWTQHTKVDKASLALYAKEDVRGVQRCNVAIFIMERRHKYKGCWVEIGVALGKGRKVIIIGHAGDSCVFVDHPNIRVISGMDNFLKLPLKSWLKDNIPVEEYIDSNPNWGKMESCTPPVNCQMKEEEVKL
jgi:hypothetical protein